MSLPRCHLAIDLETLATTPDATILSIGAVAICAETGAKRKFYSVVSIDSQTESFRSASTAKWWSEQSGAAREVLDLATGGNAPSISDVLDQLTVWVGELGQTHTVYPWGNGATFDITILEYAYHKYGGSAPWNFRNVRDMRTLYDITLRFGINARDNIERVGTHHNALDDAQFQAAIVVESLKQLDEYAERCK